jgi:dihydroneopterin aldolase
MKQLIYITGIKTYSFHGCLAEESRIGGHYQVDIKLETDFSQAALNDDLIETIDYVVVNQIVELEMAIPAKLIEHVGLRIYNTIKSTFITCNKLEVLIRKISPPINGDVDEVAIALSDFN